MANVDAAKQKIASVRCLLNYPDEETFVERYATNISKAGIFVRTRAPLDVGGELLFEFVLANGTPLMRGKGRVAWNRIGSLPGGPPGMGIQFLSLDAKGKQLLRKVLKLKSGRRETGEDTTEKTGETIQNAKDPPATPKMGEVEVPERDGADLNMSDKTQRDAENKVAGKLDLDEIDSMLDQIATGSSKKKKRRVKRRPVGTATSKAVEETVAVAAPKSTPIHPEPEPEPEPEDTTPPNPPSGLRVIAN